MPPTVLEVLAEGSGALPTLGDKVVCHYTGYLQSGMTKFDCSRDRGHAMMFPVGVGKVIDGWDMAVREMAKGSRRRILIPAAEAYGAKGQPPKIPPNADLIFDIEVMDVNETLVAEGMRIRREEAARADRFIREQDAARAAAVARTQQQPLPARRSESDDSSDDSSGSSSSSEEEERLRAKKRKRDKDDRKRHKHEKHSKKHKREKKKKSKDKKEKRHKSKSDKRHKRDRHESAVSSAAPKWGAFGIIKESDMYEKQEEFLAWLTEVKGIPQESCGRRELQEHFSSFVEDFNTATMPSEKYYNMRTWYIKEEERKQREGGSAVADEAAFERTSFDDEADRKATEQRERARREHARTMLIAKSMHSSSHLVEDMRAQEEKRLRMQDAYKTGDADAARELAKKLDPKYVSPEELRATFGGPATINKKGANCKS